MTLRASGIRAFQVSEASSCRYNFQAEFKHFRVFRRPLNVKNRVLNNKVNFECSAKQELTTETTNCKFIILKIAFSKNCDSSLQG